MQREVKLDYFLNVQALDKNSSKYVDKSLSVEGILKHILLHGTLKTPAIAFWSSFPTGFACVLFVEVLCVQHQQHVMLMCERPSQILLKLSIIQKCVSYKIVVTGIINKSEKHNS